MKRARRRRRLLAAASAGLLAMSLVVSELLHWRTARTAGALPATGRGAIVVLGVSGTNIATRAAQRWRVGLAVDVWRRCRCERVVFTGAALRTPRSEAAEMAAMAERLGLPPDVIVLDERSRSTRENVREAAALVGDVDYVVIASDAMHAARARADWHQQHPQARRCSCWPTATPRSTTSGCGCPARSSSWSISPGADRSDPDRSPGDGAGAAQQRSARE